MVREFLWSGVFGGNTILVHGTSGIILTLLLAYSPLYHLDRIKTPMLFSCLGQGHSQSTRLHKIFNGLRLLRRDVDAYPLSTKNSRTI